jgi:hypothetical protein
LSERLIHQNSSLHPDRTRNPSGTECLAYPAPLPHHRGTPARRAILPGMPIPYWTRRPALPGDMVRERIQYYPVNVRNHQVPGKPLAPRRGIPSGRGSPDHSWRQGLKGPPPGGTPSSAPLPLRMPSHEGNWPSHHPHPRVVRDTRRPPHRTSGIPLGAGEGPGATPPPDPSSQYCELGAPGF